MTVEERWESRILAPALIHFTGQRDTVMTNLVVTLTERLTRCTILAALETKDLKDARRAKIISEQRRLRARPRKATSDIAVLLMEILKSSISSVRSILIRPSGAAIPMTSSESMQMKRDDSPKKTAIWPERRDILVLREMYLLC